MTCEFVSLSGDLEDGTMVISLVESKDTSLIFSLNLLHIKSKSKTWGKEQDMG